MNLGYRATRRLQPKSDETLVSSPAQARSLLADLDKKIANRKFSKHEKAVFLCARAVLYEALGDPQMLEAAQEAFSFSKNSQSAALVAVAFHHFGRIKEALLWYERSWKYPHEAGWEIDIGYASALVFQNRWHEANQIALQLKKRMVYALHLREWTQNRTDKVTVISEGGYGDIIHYSRWLPFFKELGVSATVYLPDYFYESGLVDLLRRQKWFPPIKHMLETPQHVPAVGFIDLPPVFDATYETIPFYPEPWKADPLKTDSRDLSTLRTDGRPLVGFCWAARAMETPICPPNVYRAMSGDKSKKIIDSTADKINWVSLQLTGDDAATSKIQRIPIKSWEDTAAIIANLDAVVTVDTSILHLAGAMGKPVWVILSGALDSKFGLEGTTHPLYPTMRLFRNDGFGFDRSIENVITALNKGTPWLE